MSKAIVLDMKRETGKAGESQVLVVLGFDSRPRYGVIKKSLLKMMRSDIDLLKMRV